MKKTLYILAVVLFVFSACPEFEPLRSPGSVSVFLDGREQSALTIEEGQSLTLQAKVSPSMDNVFIIWEANNPNIAIVSSGEGAECTIRGMKAEGEGTARITVKAWRDSGDSPAVKRISVTIKSAAVTDIIFHGPQSIFAGEQQALSAALVPAWAENLDITWSDEENLTLADGKITGGSAGPAKITATAGGISATFDIMVKAVPVISGLAIYNGTVNVTGSSIEIGLYEEIALSALPTPASETFFTWNSDNPAVSVKNGVIKGLQPGGTAIIEAGAGGFTGTKQVNVTVKDPVTGIMIKYDNNESLPVSNVIWLAPGDEVKLKVESAGGAPAEINWPVNNSEFTLTPGNGGINCTVAYKNTGAPLRFDDPPVELRVTAQNADNNTEVSAVVLIKKLDSKPIWAWDRARDADSNTALSTLNASATIHYLSGRGEKTSVPSGVWGYNIPYLPEGLKLNSSNNYSGKNPDPIATPAPNSTRIAVGITERTATAEKDKVDGVFDFLEAFCEKDGDGYEKDSTGNYVLKPDARGKIIRVSVDYEIIWTAGAGRDMWLMLNNNNANAAQSVMSTDSQILIEPLIAARGARATAVTYIDVWDMVERRFKWDEKDHEYKEAFRGIETLEKAFICVIALSNGGSIYVSGIRIEYENE
ncbi:MAG: hypothetical protein LBH20_01490 [Treponema sp.]|jgi:hypothetical protein|nr:hypothetical protein [Treponema sp.]